MSGWGSWNQFLTTPAWGCFITDQVEVFYIQISSTPESWIWTLEGFELISESVSQQPCAILQTHLDKLYSEIGKALEKLASREKYINKQLEHLLTDYRTQSDTLAATRARCAPLALSVHRADHESSTKRHCEQG